MLNELFRHTDARVGDTVSHIDMFVVFPGKVADGIGDGAAVVCKLHRVSQNVYKHLAHAHRIRQHIARRRLFFLGAEGKVPV